MSTNLGGKYEPSDPAAGIRTLGEGYLMRWGYVLLVAPVLVLLIMGLYVLQKCGVYKIEGDPDPMGLSDEGMWVDDVDLDEYGRVTSRPPSNS